MKGIELLRLVWLNLNQNKFKAIMTSIGIVVGAATIMLVFGIGLGGRMDIAEQFAELNAGEINITYEYAGEEITKPSGNSWTVAPNTGINSEFGKGMGNGTEGKRQRPESAQMGSSQQNLEPLQAGNTRKRPEATQMGDAQRESAQIRGERQDSLHNNFGENEKREEAADSSVDKETEEADIKENQVAERLNQEQYVFSQEDVDEIQELVTGITGVTLTYTTKASVEGGELTSAQTYTIAGVKDTFAGVSRLQMAKGYFLTKQQEEVCARVCVLGSEVAKELFQNMEEATEAIIYIGDRTYKVCGILESSDMISGGISLDDSIYVPYETGVKYITGDHISPKLTVVAEDVNTLQEVIDGVKAVLAYHYDNAEFTFEDSGAKMKSALSSNRILTMLLSAMAAIVFIVGGIGIMNVLFVSVKERTNEIGILKAIGTSRGMILMEFLMESAAISLLGGLIGVGISFGILPLLQYFQIRVEMTGMFVLISLGFAILTGTLFGLYPAWKASQLEPVDALSAD